MCVRAYLKYAVQYGVTHAFVQEGFSFNAFSSDAGESTVIASAGDDTNFQFELQLRLLRVRISHLAQHCVAVKHRTEGSDDCLLAERRCFFIIEAQTEHRTFSKWLHRLHSKTSEHTVVFYWIYKIPMNYFALLK